MKTTEFFKEIKKVAKDSTIENMFAYSVNRDKYFYEIFLHSEPTKKVQDMCANNGFSIKQNIMYRNVGGEMGEHTIWEVRPVDVNDIEYVANKEILHNVNPYVIIATDQAMIDAGLIKCNPRQDEITLWVYEFNPICKEMQWAPIMQVFATPLENDIKDEEGRVIEGKSTHKIDAFYGAPVVGELDLRRYLVTRGVDVKPLKP